MSAADIDVTGVDLIRLTQFAYEFSEPPVRPGLLSYDEAQAIVAHQQNSLGEGPVLHPAYRPEAGL